MKVFGIGLSRTGTTSLTAALTILGFRTIHYPQDAITERELRARPPPDSPLQLSVLRRHDAMTDTPTALCFRQLDLGYPGSRFVLTLRDEEMWLRSCERHYAKSTRPRGYLAWVREQVYGTAVFDPDQLLRAHRAHLAAVREYFVGRTDLLELNICGGQGWSELCPFLGRSLPTNPFPRLNAS